MISGIAINFDGHKIISGKTLAADLSTSTYHCGFDVVHSISRIRDTTSVIQWGKNANAVKDR